MKSYMSKKIRDIFLKYILPKKTYNIEEPENITDEIEKSLWEIKESFDIPTEEVARSIAGYKNRKLRE